MEEHLHYEPVVRPRAHEYVAEQLRRHIALRIVDAGEALPPERTLVTLFKVGRPTVQQAIKTLEEDGLVERRRGRNGGTFVRPLPGEEGGDGRDLAAELLRQRRDLLDVLELRLLLEPMFAERAAEHIDPVGNGALREIHERLARTENDVDFERVDTEFHVHVAKLSGNRRFVTAAQDVRRELTTVLRALPESQLWRKGTLADHSLVISAIDAGERDLARAAMRVHVAQTDQSVRALLSSLELSSRQRRAGSAGSG